MQGLQRLADAAHFRTRSRGDHAGDALPLHHQLARVDHRCIVAAPTQRHRRTRVRVLAHGNGFAGEQRFVDLQAIAHHQQRVRRHPIALRKQDDVVAHHLAPGDALLFAITQHQRTRAAQIAQGLQNPFGLVRLIEGDAHHHAHEEQQQREHRLADHVEHHGCGATRSVGRQHVRPLRLQTRARKPRSGPERRTTRRTAGVPA